jgi:hypothetical protein
MGQFLKKLLREIFSNMPFWDTPRVPINRPSLVFLEAQLSQTSTENTTANAVIFPVFFKIFFENCRFEFFSGP